MTFRRLTIAAAVLLCALTPSAWAADGPQPEIDRLAGAWAHVTYEARDRRSQAAEAERLAAEAERLGRAHPERAEPRAWQALLLLTEADALHNMHALKLAHTARELLESVLKVDPAALGPGFIDAQLGALYDQVPKFPLGFGDAKRARRHFERALAAAPQALDVNFFYGEHLARRHDYAGARAALRRALQAPTRPGRELADRGRRGEAERLLKEIEGRK